MDLEAARRETFAACLGEVFELGRSPDGPEAPRLSLRLTAADPLPDPPSPSGREPFSLMFAGPVEPIMTQGIYRLGHPGLGDVELFLVPLAPDDGGARYQAVFN